jgi:hypothetical protein
MTASASAGPDAYPLVSTVNMLYLHASPSLPLHFALCAICLSFLCFLAIVIILCFIPGEF